MNIQTLQSELDALKSNLSEKPNSCEHLLPTGYEFCTEEEAVKWVKVKLVQDGKNELPLGATVPDCQHVESLYRPIRPIQYHVAVHEAVTVESNPYAVDWSNAPEWADVHCFDDNGRGHFYGTKRNSVEWFFCNFGTSYFTLPTGLDWKLSKTIRP